MWFSEGSEKNPVWFPEGSQKAQPVHGFSVSVHRVHRNALQLRGFLTRRLHKGVPSGVLEIVVPDLGLRQRPLRVWAELIEADLGEGDAMKQKSVKKVHCKKGRHSMNEGLGKKFYRKDNSLKKSGQSVNC